MSDTSAILSMPYIQPAQAQKHVTHNEALTVLDAIVQLAVTDRDRTAPPASPTEGDRHVVAPGATGDWAGRDGAVAVSDAGMWAFHTPNPGWQAYVLDEDRVITWRDGAWQDAGDQPFQTSELGINATADSTNRLSVSAPATLLSHAGAGHQLKLNKAATGETASLLYQSNWSGRAEMGLAGSDTFAIKVSGDGAAWTTALAFDGASGIASGAAVQSGALDDTAGRLLGVGAFGLGDSGSGVAAPSDDADLCVAAGTYSLTAAGSNTPVADPSGGSLMVLRGGAGTARQIYVAETGQRVWSRGYAAGWQPWVEMFTQASVVGPVAQTGGTPSGAVIESGSNANGEYTRWADGTQICTNGNAAITTDPAAFSGTVTSIDGDKLRIGRWF
ncbi:DUF2793 domain-containing protein [Pseudooceanicola sediminis]|uniref:DUF2793 domain-containing protein n=1 Tax=Pseudooceanicola sediminis TaxID=2211117 RepID=UPI001F172462|nr:DUF2793 domain-containing protein [Pseudooceanicola sediminis]|tara:strand:+ start:59881 stop:61044 length:1164 start_codon:yes stop_codon:yes gene_type:complete